MKTYCVTAPRKRLKELAEQATVAITHRERGVLVFPNSFEVPAELVVEVHDGDRSMARSNWAKRSVLDELHAEFMAADLPGKAAQSRALKRYQDAQSARTDAEIVLRKAQKREHEAAAGLVRCFGRGTIVIEGVAHDASFRGETVFYIRRQNSD